MIAKHGLSSSVFCPLNIISPVSRMTEGIHITMRKGRQIEFEQAGRHPLSRPIVLAGITGYYVTEAKLRYTICCLAHMSSSSPSLSNSSTWLKLPMSEIVEWLLASSFWFLFKQKKETDSIWYQKPNEQSFTLIQRICSQDKHHFYRFDQHNSQPSECFKRYIVWPLEIQYPTPMPRVDSFCSLTGSTYIIAL